MSICVFEAYFHARLDSESKKLMKNKEKDGKNNDLHK